MQRTKSPNYLTSLFFQFQVPYESSKDCSRFSGCPWGGRGMKATSANRKKERRNKGGWKRPTGTGVESAQPPKRMKRDTYLASAICALVKKECNVKGIGCCLRQTHTFH